MFEVGYCNTYWTFFSKSNQLLQFCFRLKVGITLLISFSVL